MISLRPLLLEDAPKIYYLVDKNRTHLDHLLFAKDATLKSTFEYVTRVINKDLPDDVWVIFVDHHMAGLFTLRNFGKHFGVGYWLSEEFCDRGVMSQVLKEKLKDVCVPVKACTRTKNIPSQRVLQKAGFVLESVLPQKNDTGEWFYWVYHPKVN